MAKTPSTIPSSKPRNPVVKNMKNTGTKVHTDKKKAAKQGTVKHKGRQEYAEHLQRLLLRSLTENYKLSEISRPRDTKGIQQRITELSQEKEKLEIIVNKARNITRSVKYEPVALEIIAKLKSLSEEVSIDPREFQYYENQVLEAQQALQAAVYNLDDVFVDLYKRISDQIEDLQNDLDELGNNS
jgi:hypothetical protein